MLGQKSLEAGDVKLISGGFVVDEGTNVDESRYRKDTVLVVPAGKVWKFESFNTGYSTYPHNRIYSDQKLMVSIHHSPMNEAFHPFYLPAGSYHMVYSINLNTVKVTYEEMHTFFLSVTEYTVKP